MAEIRITPQLSSEFDALKTAGEALNGSYQKTGMLKTNMLPTAIGFLEEEEAIYELLTLYQELLLKDSNDMLQMAENMKQTDEKMAQSYGEREG